MQERSAPQQEATINGRKSRSWTLEQGQCAELAAHRIARVGIDVAYPTYRRLRLNPAGSFFMANLEGKGAMWLEGRWQTVKPGTLCLAPPRILNALAATDRQRWIFAWVRYDEPTWVKPLVGASSPLRATEGAEQLGRVVEGLRTAWNGKRDPAEIHHWVDLVQRLCVQAARPWQRSQRIGTLWESVMRDLTSDWKLSALAARCNVSAELGLPRKNGHRFRQL